MKSLSLLIKPSSGACNIDCTYCFYKTLIKSESVTKNEFMTLETVDKLIGNVFASLKNGDFLEISFQGGEPSLMGLEFYKYFINKIQEENRPRIEVAYNFQTNGIFLDETWCEFFLENKFLIGLSLDGPKEINDKYRISSQGHGTFEKLMETKNLLDDFGVQYNILSVLTKDLAEKPKEIWDFIKENKLNYVQFIPCIEDLDHQESAEFALTAEYFSAFYNKVFKLWHQDFLKGNYYSISFIDQIINLIGRGAGASCAIMGRCSPQYVIESDGTVYPCDFYVLDRYACGNIRDKTLEETFYADNMQNFLKENKPLSPSCKTCRYFFICNGGCKRMKKAVYAGKDDFCGMKDFLDKNIAEIIQVIDLITK